jgi:hypothetical protein
MNRRGFLRGTLGTLSAAVGAIALRNSVDARETAAEGVQGQSVADNMLVSIPHYTGTELDALPRHTHPLMVAQGTSLTRTTYQQATPFTTEQMVQLRDEHRALPNAFNAWVASGPHEGEMYTVRVFCEVGGLATAPLLR